MQPWFSLAAFIGAGAIAALVLWFSIALTQLPDRGELGVAQAVVMVEPVAVGPMEAPLKLAGAWRLKSDDPRFGGFSAMAVDGEGFVALSDSGAVVRLPKAIGARTPSLVRELPDGPGSPAFKSNRDSEALIAASEQGGWWVAFENRNALWGYDRDFRQVTQRIAYPGAWAVNRGVEGMASDGAGLLLFAEKGDVALRFAGGRFETIRLPDIGGSIADAATLEDGRMLLLRRKFTLRGLRADLLLMAATGSGLEAVRRFELPSGPLDNMEALAVERRGAGYRLWVMSDDNQHWPLRTLLLAIDAPEAAFAL